MCRIDLEDKKYLIDEPATIIEVENAIVLPCIKDDENSGPGQIYKGGICDSMGKFLVGHVVNFNNQCYRNWWTCLEGYKIDKSPKVVNETVIFGGFIHGAFGHFITESISRLWFIIKNTNLKHKIIFLNLSKSDVIKYEDVLNLIGLRREQYEFVTEITQFDKVIVPDQSLYIGTGYKRECQCIYDAMISRVKPMNFSKIYLSNSKYPINSSKREVYFENFYRKRGFEIIYPETLPFAQQVAIINGADEIVCTNGTIQHLTFFCKNHTKLTILARDNSKIKLGNLESSSIEMRKLESYLVNIAYNFLPVKLSGGNKYFWGPTEQWIEYLNSQNITYDFSEVSFDIHVKPFIYDYLIEWTLHYSSNPNKYNRIKNFTLLDVLDRINKTFLNTTLDKELFSEPDNIVEMRNKLEQLSINNKDNLF